MQHMRHEQNALATYLVEPLCDPEQLSSTEQFSTFRCSSTNIQTSTMKVWGSGTHYNETKQNKKKNLDMQFI